MGVGKYDPTAFAGYCLVAVSMAGTGRDLDERPEAAEPVEVRLTNVSGSAR